MTDNEKFLKYYELLRGAKINVTAITDYESIKIKHFEDSLFVMNIEEFKVAKNIIDVGSGGGFPGVPLAIENPQKDIVLLETVGKKADFLQNVVNSLELDNTKVLWQRAEDAARDETYRETFDMAVSRAVAPLNLLLEYTLPFVKVGGCVIAYKSGEYSKEIEMAQNALKVLGAAVLNIFEYDLSKNSGKRALILIKKEVTTDSKYPRRAGIPKKRPL